MEKKIDIIEVYFMCEHKPQRNRAGLVTIQQVRGGYNVACFVTSRKALKNSFRTLRESFEFVAAFIHDYAVKDYDMMITAGGKVAKGAPLAAEILMNLAAY